MMDLLFIQNGAWLEVMKWLWKVQPQTAKSPQLDAFEKLEF